MGLQRLFLVSHQQGRRKKVYSEEKFVRLRERAAQWVDYKLGGLAQQRDKQTRAILEKLKKTARKRRIPSELQSYADSIELCMRGFRLAEAEFEWAKELIGYKWTFGKALPVNPEQFGWAILRVSEAPREMTALEMQHQVYRDFYSTTKRRWGEYWRRLHSFARKNPALFKTAQELNKTLTEAQQEHRAVHQQAEQGLGFLERDIAVGLVRERQRGSKRKKILGSLFEAREKLGMALLDWNRFWLRAANGYIQQKKLPKSFRNELVRRMAHATEQIARARLKIL